MKKSMICTMCDIADRTGMNWVRDTLLYSGILTVLVSFVIWPLFVLWPFMALGLGAYALSHVACGSCKLPASGAG